MLTDIKIKQTKATDKPIRLTDGNGLYIEITTSGKKHWRYRYKINGKENIFSIGEYPKISLQAARKARDEARELVKKGIHPAHARQREKALASAGNANTFEAIAREWLSIKATKCTPHYLKQVTNCLEANVFPLLGKLPISDITSSVILMILKDMEKRGSHSYALLLRQWLSAVFKYAIVTLRAESDPTYVLQGAIERPTVTHSTAMTREQLLDFKLRLAKYNGHYATIFALKMMFYVFVRTNELRHAQWSEIDFEAKEWRIPSERMKMKRTHIVPLARQVIELLRKLQQVNGGGEYLFPHLSKQGSVMSANTINMALSYMGYKQYEWTGHDFRATASTHLHEMGFDDHLIELQLAHVEGNRTKRAYNHARYLAERAAMMQAWADWIDEI